VGRVFQIKVHVEPDGLDDQESPLRFRAADDSWYVTDQELDQVRARGIVAEILREIRESEVPVRFLLPHHGAVNDPPPESARLAVLARLLAEDRAGGEVHIRFMGRNRTVPPSGFLLDRAGGDRRYVWQVVPAEGMRETPELHDRFRALRAAVARQDTRVVLSLGSGGLKLFCHASALRLLERIGCGEHIDEVWGSSAGALVALLYAHGLSPHAIEQTGYDIYSGRYELSLRPTAFQILRHLIRDVVLARQDSHSAGFVDCAQSLSGMLSRYCDEGDPLFPFYAVAYNLSDCRSEVLTSQPVPDHLRGLMVQTDARHAALASAAVPLLFVPQEIDRYGTCVPYIDGSTTEDVPLRSVVEKWDLDREADDEPRDRLLILSVKLTGRPQQYRSKSGRMSKLRLLRIVASAGIETMHRREVELLRARPDVELLELELDDSTPDFFETRRIPEFVRRAKETFPEQLAAIEERLRGR
jgi:predicted acylesterase/phospholipase RssA